jgi:hypothetical protein
VVDGIEGGHEWAVAETGVEQIAVDSEKDVVGRQ